MISIMENAGDKEQMKAFYKKALSQDPDNATLIYNLGILHYETGDLKQSRPYFEKYSESFPKDKDVHSFLFDIYKKSGNEAMAFQEAQVLLQLDPKKTEPYHFMFTYLNDRKEYSKLIGIMEKGAETFPNNADIRQYLIVAYLKTGQEKKAVDQLGTLLKTKPKDVSLWLQLAQLQERLGNNRGALQSLEKALEISPDDKTAKASYLGLLTRQATQQEDAGRLPEAIESYKKILEYDPGNEAAQEAYLRLRLKAL
jgi:tetratricopeptide (TPR) repeat protein